MSWRTGARFECGCACGAPRRSGRTTPTAGRLCNGWPTFDTQTHQQTYYVWLQRAWEAGERLLVVQTADDQPLCQLEPRRDESCDETTSIKAQIRALRGLQDYVDAQNGGPGRGWFRLVYSPAQARRVIAGGKLAVIIGIESSDLFGCSERGGRAQCTRAEDRPRHAASTSGSASAECSSPTGSTTRFGGAALEGRREEASSSTSSTGCQTGSYFTTAAVPGCRPGRHGGDAPATLLQFALAASSRRRSRSPAQPMPTYPPGLQCNTEGLTPLGGYLIKRLISQHMLIEVDHLSERARDTVLRWPSAPTTR